MFRRTTPGRRRLPRNERGQSLVEFAFVLPVLALILVGILQLGLLFFNYIDLASAARDGGRKMTVSRTVTGPTAVVKAAVAASTTAIDDSKTTVTVAKGGVPITSTTTLAAGDDVTVTVSYPYKLNILGVGLWNGPMVSKTVVRLE